MPFDQNGLCAQPGLSDTRFIWLRADDGLPSSQISCLLEDRMGYLWLGTAAGLSRYDGQHVASFGIRDGLPHIRIKALAEDGEGRIWALCNQQISFFSGGRFQVVTLPDDAGPALAIGSDADGAILAASSGQLYRFSGDRFREVLPAPGQEWNHPQPLFSDSSGSWIFNRSGGYGSLVLLSGGTARSFPLQHSLRLPERFQALGDGKGHVLYTADAGIILLDPDRTAQKILAAANPIWDPASFTALLLDRHNRLWISEGDSRLSCWYWNKEAYPDSLWLLPVKCANPNREIEDLLQDREGNIWFATGEDGAAFLPGNASFVRNLTVNSGLADNVVFSVAGEGNQNIWFGMRGGQVDVLNFAGIGGVTNPLMGRAGSSPVVALLQAPDGTMLAGSDDGLYQSRYRLLERYGPLRGIRSLALGKDSTVFVGTTERLYGFDPEALRKLADLEEAEEIDRQCILSDRPALRIAPRPEGGCWYANEEGLFRFDGFETSRPDISRDLLAATISDLELIEGGIAVATRGDGLWLLREGESPWQIDALSGLPSNICSDLYGQEDNILWVATNRGIARLDLRDAKNRQLVYESYDIKDGLLSNEINAMLALRGSLYLGTNSGISIFNESDFRTQSVAPGIYLMSVAIADRDTVILSEYDLPYSRNRVSIRFSGIAFSSGNLIQYRYRLLGLDDRWTVSSSGEVRYASLSPGHYVFEVQSINKDGLLSAETATLSIRISRPWYQHPLFLLAAGLLLAALGYALYAFLLGRNERRTLQRSVSDKTAELDRKIRELRRSNDELEQFAYIASHDLKEPLRNISNYVQLLQRNLNGQLDADAYQYMHFAVNGVRRMYDMIDGLLLYSGLTQPDPSVQPVDLNALLEEVIHAATRAHPDRQLVFTKNSLPTAQVNRNQIRELLEQLIDNAIKFNDNSVIRIRIDAEEREEELQISIEDNGIGLAESYHDKVFQIFERLDLSEARPGSGIGLALCKKIVERHGGRIWFRSEDRGAVFFFTLRKNLQNQTR